MQLNSVKSSASSIPYWLLFCIYPLFSLFIAFKEYKKPFAKNILWAFIVFYGFTFTIGNESSTSDIVRYVEQFQVLYHEYFTIEKALNYYHNSGEVDILRTFLAISVSRFTASQPIITGIYAIIFGFFFSRNIFYVLDRLNGELKYVTILLLICLALVVPIWNINGFRMYTAMHIFLYGLYPYLFYKKIGKLWWCAAAILVHYSFLFPLTILAIYLLAGNRVWMYFMFFIVSIFISEIDIETINQLFENYMPAAFKAQSEGYLIVEKVEEFRENQSANKVWYAVWYMKVLNYSVTGLLILMFLKLRKSLRDHKSLYNIFCFTLLFYGAANLISSLPSGGRYLNIGALCGLTVLILYIQNVEYKRVISKWIPLTLPFLLLFIVITVRIGLYSISLITVAGNPVIAMLAEGGSVALNDLIK